MHGRHRTWSLGTTSAIVDGLPHRSQSNDASLPQDLVEALAQQNFWIGRTGYLSDQGERLVEADGTKNYVTVQVIRICCP